MPFSGVISQCPPLLPIECDRVVRVVWDRPRCGLLSQQATPIDAVRARKLPRCHPCDRPVFEDDAEIVGRG
jgi:hypothetical protein